MSTTDNFSDTKDVAKDHAQQAAQAVQARTGEVAGHAKEATQDVAATAAEQVANVKQETVRQTRNLLSEASSQVSTQAGEQTQRLTQLLRELADELKQMASAGNGGQASELAHQASERAHQAASYLEGRQPSELRGGRAQLCPATSRCFPGRRSAARSRRRARRTRGQGCQRRGSPDSAAGVAADQLQLPAAGA